MQVFAVILGEMVCIRICISNLCSTYLLIELDAPPSDGLIDHPQVTDGLLIFTIIATVIFIAISIALIVLTIALRKNK